MHQADDAVEHADQDALHDGPGLLVDAEIRQRRRFGLGCAVLAVSRPLAISMYQSQNSDQTNS